MFVDDVDECVAQPSAIGCVQLAADGDDDAAGGPCETDQDS